MVFAVLRRVPVAFAAAASARGYASSAKKINVALVGTGRMGLIRARGIRNNGDFNLAAVVDVDLAKAQAVAETAKAAATTDLKSVLGDRSIDAVVVTVPTHHHHALIVDALSARKAVFVEKPVAETVEKIADCFDVAARTRTPLLCGFQRRFDSSYVKLRERVLAGDIGKVHTVHCVMRDHPLPPIEFLKTGGDAFLDLAVHDIDFIRYLLGGNPTAVFARGKSLHPELRKVHVHDTALVHMEFPDEVMATIELSRGSCYGYDQRIEVFGDKGMLQVTNPTATHVTHAGPSGVATDVYVHSFPQRFADAYDNELRHFADIVLRGAAPIVGRDDCIYSVKIAEAAGRSSNTGALVSIQ